ncbi:conserved hypothetical protein [Theileria orientalis strain Shintoku]|uniref:Uncharacterized protein n=1 Tax=Theileria orientalis strain Shintoku TaxID=869250 RepID=J4C846_THEOR|nr:conserved hypothetical protein [Theileria orientalis strain Shintoku]BAM40153.1 conserved hypothetical protein [Theileria orientalis strain Shintoku]|eukprot:XP_009690454.1 conserved hypothetical protein [Theileria orientalis strain Shintoku]
MKFIYKLDSVMSPMGSLTDSYDMDYDDVSPRSMMFEDSKSSSFLEKGGAPGGVVMQLSTYSMYPNEHSQGQDCNMKPVDTDDVASANGHYTLEDFFSNYRELTRNESIGDVCESGLDFSKLYGQIEEPATDNPFQSLIDLVKCEIPADLSAVDIRFPKDEKVAPPPKAQAPEEPPCKLVVRTEPAPTAAPRPKPKSKKTRKAAPAKADHGTKLVEKEYVNSRKIDYGANDTIENLYDLEWHPGFTRHLGAKGRSALLELLRRVYRQDPEHYKAILQSRNSPSSISSLPFFSIPMLWELAHQFGIFKQALTVYKNHCFAKSKSNRFYGFGRGSQTSASSDSSDNYVEVKKEQSYSTLDPKGSITTMSGRLVKRSKKILEYTPDSITENLTNYASAFSSPSNELNDQLQDRLDLNASVKAEPVDVASASQSKKGADAKVENTPEPSLVWKMTVVTRSSNLADSCKDTQLTPKQSLQRRISV